MVMKTGIQVEAIPGGQTKSTIDACFRLQFMYLIFQSRVLPGAIRYRKRKAETSVDRQHTSLCQVLRYSRDVEKIKQARRK